MRDAAASEAVRDDSIVIIDASESTLPRRRAIDEPTLSEPPPSREVTLTELLCRGLSHHTILYIYVNICIKLQIIERSNDY